jgi:glyoxylase-like metal-dependent hydrolase (beta-lactamase superfamily II)
VQSWEPFRLNVGLVLGHELALLIDTGASAEMGGEIVEQARSVTDLPLGAVNSHFHFDHCFGNAALDGGVIWSHRLCAQHLRWEGAEQQRSVIAELRTAQPQLAQQVAASQIVTPECVFEDRAELNLGERVILLVHPGRGHTDNDVAVWIEDARILFTGDLAEEGAAPSFEDSFPLEWPDALAVLLALDPEQVVPGHGAVVDAGSPSSAGTASSRAAGPGSSTSRPLIRASLPWWPSAGPTTSWRRREAGRGWNDSRADPPAIAGRTWVLAVQPSDTVYFHCHGEQKSRAGAV